MSEMSNQEWEIVQRVKMYRKKALEVLKSGGSLQELGLVTDMGMHLRIEIIKEKVGIILSKTDISLEDKAQLIAEELVEVEV